MMDKRCAICKEATWDFDKARGLCGPCATREDDLFRDTNHVPQLFYTSVDIWIRHYGPHESVVNWLKREGAILLFRGGAPHSGVEGGMLWVSVSSFRGKVIYIHDCDDGCIAKEVRPNEVGKEIEALKNLAPVSMWELVEMFGYEWNY